MRATYSLVFIALWLMACGGAPGSDGPSGPGANPGTGQVLRGKATWYGGRFHGRKTASGERFNQNAMTAAHRRLPFGTVVRVTNLKNGRTVTLRINDRGPFGGGGRIIDVSRGAAERLGMIRAGVVPVTVEVVRRPP